MVVQKTLDSLKDKPHEEKKAVATSVAVGVVIILLIGWGFLFLRKIQRGTVPTLEGGLVPQDQFNAAVLRDTQQQINSLYQDSTDELRDLRGRENQNGSADATVVTPGASTEVGSDEFGTE